MKKVTVVLILLVFTLQGQTSKKVVGYFPAWGKWMTPSYTWRQVDFSQINHIAWAFMYPDAAGKLVGLSSDNSIPMDSLISKAHAHGAKVLLSLGGAGNCDGFAPMATNDATRATFCHNVKAFITERGIDGIDIDWEYTSIPSSQDTAGYRKLVHELRDTLGSSALITMALPCSPYWGKWFSVEGFLDDVDWIGIMTYDITGSWASTSGYNSPLYPRNGITDWSWEQSMTYWTGRGVPKSKLLPGIPTYGYAFAQSTGPGASFTGDVEYTSYTNIMSHNDWVFHWDDIAMVPYAITPSGGYVTFENARSVACKSRWLSDNEYAGVIIWELSQDYHSNGETPLMGSIAAILMNSSVSVSLHKNISTVKKQVSISKSWISVQDYSEKIPIRVLDLRGKLVADNGGKSGRVFIGHLTAGFYIVEAGEYREKSRWGVTVY